MNPHCRGCKYHSNAGHPKDSPNVRFNDWCCKHGKVAKKAIGQCKLNNSKEVK